MLKKTIQQKSTLKPAKLGSPEGQNLVLFLLPYIEWRKDEKSSSILVTTRKIS